jgi:hypothetical protein
MKKPPQTNQTKTSSTFAVKPLKNILFIIFLMMLSLFIFALLFIYKQEWITFPFSTLG